MKLLLFFTLSFIGTGVFAQVPNQKNPLKVPSPDSLQNFKGNNGEQLRKQYQEYFERRKFENQLLADKQGSIGQLPQDHMPCVVPESASAAIMPNAWSGVTVPFRPQFHTMPNPALPKEPSLQNENGDKKDATK